MTRLPSGPDFAHHMFTMLVWECKLFQVMVLNRFFILAIYCIASIARVAMGAEWFSDKPRDLDAMLADPREAQARLGYLYSGNKKSYLDLALGGHLGVVRQDDTSPEEARLVLEVKGLITSRFQFTSSYFDYQNGDMIGGLAGTRKARANVTELSYYHQSSHLGADALVHSGRSFKVFSFEALRILDSYTFSKTLRIYGGGEIKTRANPSKLAGKMTAILGGDYRFIPSLPDLFLSADMRFRGENDWAPNTSLVIGYELGELNKVIHRQRIFLEFFNGYSNEGQFSEERECYLFLGLGFTL